MTNIENQKMMPEGSDLDDSAAQWAGLADALQNYDMPPAPDTQALIARLTPLVKARQSTRQRARLTTTWHTRWLTLIRTQGMIFESSFWIASLLVLGIGVVVGLYSDVGTLPTLFTCFAPLLGAAGVTYAFRPATEGLRELERISPIRPLELLYSRMIPILICDGIITLVLLTLVSTRTPDITLWRLLLAWIGPLLGLTALALYSAIRWGNIAGVAVPLVLWVAFVLFGWQQAARRSAGTFDLTEGARWWWMQANNSNWVLVGSGLLLIGGLILSWETQRLFAQAKGD